MPTYEYRCAECGSAFELRRSVHDTDAEVRCPEGHTSVRRLFSVFASTRAGGAEAVPAGGGGGCCGGACGCG